MDSDTENNTGSKVMGVEFAPMKIPFARRLQTFAVMAYASTFLFFAFGGIFICIYLFFFTTYLHYIPVIYLTWFWTDRDICNRGGRMLNFARRSILWKWFRDYFPIHLIKTAELAPKRNYIFGYHPHGIMCAGAFCNFSTEANGFSQKFPGLTSRLIALEGQFLFPFHRDFVLAHGTCASTKEGIEYLISQEGAGNAAVLVIGGAAEALDAHPKKCVLTIKRRKGFVRLALKHGASLVPVYSFGENDLYEQVNNPEGSWLRYVQNWLTKKMGVSLPILKGRGVFQYSFGYLPYRKPIYTVVGKPIYLDKVTNPTDEYVNEIHEKYCNSLIELFEEHKAKYGYENETLIIK